MEPIYIYIYNLPSNPKKSSAFFVQRALIRTRERPASSYLRWSTKLVTLYNGCPDHLERKLYCGEQD